MGAADRRALVESIRRVVVKVGTSTLTLPDMSLNLSRIEELAEQLAELKRSGKDVVLVTSGAIATGMGRLGWESRPKTIPRQQAAAAVGQSHLMRAYERAFDKYGQAVAQVLLTQADISDRRRYTNAYNTFSALLQCNVIPIVNENDTVAVEEIKVGDNDTLSAFVTNLVKADLLLILSDIDGLYDGSGQVVSVVPAITPEVRALVNGKGSELSTGGMATKLHAAEIVTGAGETMIIANGGKPRIITRVLQGDDQGTLFLPKGNKMPGRKRWIAYSVEPRGTVKIDAGAKRALVDRGKSLLPSGITEVSGDFDFGDVVRCVDEEDREFARGLSNYRSAEVNAIKGKKTDEIEAVLGHTYYDEVIHRDNLVILERQE